MAVALVFLCEVTGHLRKGLVGSKTNADRHSYAFLYLLMKFFPLCFQIQMLHAIKIDKALVYAVTEVGRCLFADD